MENNYTVPQSLDEMTLKDYITVMNFIEEYAEDELKMKKKIVQYFTGLAMRDITKMKITDFDEVINRVFNSFNEKPTFKAVTVINKKAYGFITKLENMTTEEYIDLDYSLQDKNKWDIAMGVLFRPINNVKKSGWFKKNKDYYYTISEYVSPSPFIEEMKQMKASDAIAAVVFFWTLSGDLLKASLTYTEKAMKKVKCPKKKETLQAIMDGIQVSMDLHKETSSLWKVPSKFLSDNS